MTAPKYLDTHEAAAQLSISTKQICDLIKSGKLSAVNISDGPSKPRWRISQADIDAFVEASRSRPAVKVARRKKSKPQHVTEYV